MPLRMQILAEALYLTGARVTELLTLTANSVKIDGGLAFLRLSGKGGKERVVRIPAELHARILKEFKSEPGGPLFATKSCGPFTRQYFSREIARASRRILGRTVLTGCGTAGQPICTTPPTRSRQ